MSELIEKETEEYRKGDPDPFDDRHPGETCSLKPCSTFLTKKNCLTGIVYTEVASCMLSFKIADLLKYCLRWVQ